MSGIELDSESSTVVMQQPTVATDIIRNFRDTSIIKPNKYPILAVFVPTTFILSLQTILAEVEAVNTILYSQETSLWLDGLNPQKYDPTTNPLLISYCIYIPDQQLMLS